MATPSAGFGVSSNGAGSLIFRMEVAGYEPVRVSIRRFADRVKDLKPFWVDYLAPHLYRLLQRNFETQGSMVGGWAPLSPAYAAWKAQHYPGKTILRRTDALYRSLSFDHQQAGPGGIFIATADRLVMGTAIAYAKFHQFTGALGGRGRRGVQRRIVFLPPNADSALPRLLHEWLVHEADTAGLRVATARARESSGLL